MPAAGDPSASAIARAAALDIDDLLAELRARAAGAQRSSERLAGLLDAVVTVSSHLDLPTVLARIVESACALVDARYGALGVVDGSGRQLSEFITYGIPDGLSVEGGPPAGHGVLGLLLRHPHPRRIADVSAHPAAAGVPPGHPPMHSFVGAPIRVRDQVFGNLYLTQKQGAEEFSEEDERLVVALAAAAGIAIENAQLYRRAQATRDWTAAVGDLTQTLLEGRTERTALARMVKRVRDLADADLAVLAALQGDRLVVRAAHAVAGGEGVRILPGRELPGSAWGAVLAGRAPLLLLETPQDTHTGLLSGQLRAAAGLTRPGCTALVPVSVGDVDVGLIALCWPDDRCGEALGTLEMLMLFSDQMGLAVEAARAQRDRARTALLEDRDRIARDMHDHVIQRLYATGLSLQTIHRQMDGPLALRVEAAVDELDRAVKDIRQAIFELHQHAEGGLGPQLEELVERAAESLGFVPDVTYESLTEIPEELEADVLAVVREALSNVLRHARAGDAHVWVSAVDDLVIRVLDDGVGIDAASARSGLSNLRDRAAAHGGTCAVTRRSPHGTELTWRVPLPRHPGGAVQGGARRP